MAEGAAELVVPDLADERRCAAEARNADDGVGRRAAGDFDRGSHRRIDRFRARLVDQHHGALLHAVTEQKIFPRTANDVDDGVPDAENVEAGISHGARMIAGECRAL